MKVEERFKILFVILFLLCLSSCMFCLPIKAEETDEIVIKLENLHNPNSNLYGVTFELYRVGKISDEGKPYFDGRYGIKTYPQTAQQTEETAEYLTKNIYGNPSRVLSTASDGTVIFANVEDAVYLLIAKAAFN